MIDTVLDSSHEIVDRSGNERRIPKSITDSRHDVRRTRSATRARVEFWRLGQIVVGQISLSV